MGAAVHIALLCLCLLVKLGPDASRKEFVGYDFCVGVLVSVTDILPPRALRQIDRNVVWGLLGRPPMTALWKESSTDVYLKAGVSITYDVNGKMSYMIQIRSAPPGTRAPGSVSPGNKPAKPSTPSPRRTAHSGGSPRSTGATR